MPASKNDYNAFRDDMHNRLEQYRSEQIHTKQKMFQKTLELVRKKMKNEFVKEKFDDDFVEETATSGDALINPAQEGNDGEIITQDV